MKRLRNSDSFDALISTCPSTEEKSSRSHNTIDNNGFQIQSMLLEGFEEEDYLDESSRNSKKKRRLNVDQVKALEKNFEVENKLEPERKMKLAQELGLQPRQVAIWFQNRRARWKAKQLQKDYGILKADYENLKQNFDSIQQDKEALLAELRDLKPKFQEANPESEDPIKEILISESENKVSKSKISTMDSRMQDYHPNYSNNGVRVGIEVSVSGDMKDGVSDSDSSAILNEDNNNNNNSPNPTISSSEFLRPPHLDMLPIVSSSPIFNSSSSSTINCFNFLDLTEISESTQRSYKMEQHYFSADETCNLFSDDEDPTLQWYYCSDQWN